MNQRETVVLSFAVTATVNTLAGLLTLTYVNGTTIVETNPSSLLLLQDFGAGAILIHVVEIAWAYSFALLLSLLIDSKRPIFKSKAIYRFAFLLLVTLLPIGASIDLANDIFVIALGSNLLAGPEFLGGLTFIIAIFGSTIVSLRQAPHPLGRRQEN